MLRWGAGGGLPSALRRKLCGTPDAPILATAMILALEGIEHPKFVGGHVNAIISVLIEAG